MPSAMARSERVNSSREPARATNASSLGTTCLPTTDQKAEERHLCDYNDRQFSGEIADPARCPAAAGERRQQHEHQNHDEVLDDEPADARRPSWRRARRRSASMRRTTTVLATDEARPSSEPAATVQPHASARPTPAGTETAICARAPRTAIRSDGGQIGEREVQADPEHEQDDADLGELLGKASVADEPGCERADGDTGEQVADERRAGGAGRPAGRARRR